MIELPKNITEQLKFFCEVNDLGLSQMVSENINIVLMGPRDQLNANEVALLAAKLLIDGIIQGVWSNLNAQALNAKIEEKLQ